MSVFKLFGLLLLLAPKLLLGQSTQGPAPQTAPPLRNLPCALACTPRAMAGSQDIHAHCHANCPQETAAILAQKLSESAHPIPSKTQPAKLLIDSSGNIVPPGMIPPSEDKKASMPSSKKTTDSDDDSSTDDSESTDDTDDSESDDSEDESSDDDSESKDDESEKDSDDDTSAEDADEDSSSED